MTEPPGSALEKRNCRSLKCSRASRTLLLKETTPCGALFLHGWTMDCSEKCGIIRKGIVACSLLLFLCSCGHSSSDPCESSAYDECMRRTEGTWLADAACSEVAVSQCEDD